MFHVEHSGGKIIGNDSFLCDLCEWMIKEKMAVLVFVALLK